MKFVEFTGDEMAGISARFMGYIIYCRNKIGIFNCMWLILAFQVLLFIIIKLGSSKPQLSRPR